MVKIYGFNNVGIYTQPITFEDIGIFL